MNTSKLFRDERNGAVLAIDNSEYHAFLEERERERKMEQAIKDVENLKTDISDIKQMLGILVGIKNNDQSNS